MRLARSIDHRSRIDPSDQRARNVTQKIVFRPSVKKAPKLHFTQVADPRSRDSATPGTTSLIAIALENASARRFVDAVILNSAASTRSVE
jgi:hypothetical protein